MLLAYDSLVQLSFHVHQTQRIFGRKPSQRDPSHLGDHLGDNFFVDDPIGLATLISPFPSDLLFLATELVGLIPKGCGFFKILIRDGFFLLLVEPFDILVDVLQIRRLGHRAQTDARTGLVDHIDCLIGQTPCGDVTLAHLDGSSDRIVGDLDAVMLFVTFFETLEDLDRLVLGGRLDDDLLETTSQRIVLLDVLAVLVERCRTDALDLTTR